MRARPAPRPHEVAIVLPDLHGNHDALAALLVATGATDAGGARRPGTWVCQLGDLINGTHQTREADARIVELALRTVDCVLLGNHEAPFTHGIRSFAGQADALEEPVAAGLRALADEGHLVAAAHLGAEVLITHAGLAPAWLDGGPAELAARGGDAGELAAWLNARLAAYAGRDRVLDGVGPPRGGFDAVGGVLWLDWHEKAWEAPGSLGVSQVVGHTPLPTGTPDHVARADGTWRWAIDRLGHDEGSLCALRRTPGGSLTRVLVPRPPRPYVPRRPAPVDPAERVGAARARAEAYKRARSA